MNRIAIDDEVSDLPIHTYHRVADVLEAALSKVPNNRMVANILLDGTQLSKCEDPNVLLNEPKSVEELQILTTEKSVWKRNGHDIAISHLEKLIPSWIKCTESFFDSDPIASFKLYEHCIDGVERFMECLSFIRIANQIDFKVMSFENQNFHQAETQLQLIFETLQRPSQPIQTDPIIEKVEYELLPNLSFWAKALKKLESL